MLIIRNGGTIEPLQHYKNLTVFEKVNGDHSISFTLFGNDGHYDLVVEEKIIEYNGQEYRIKTIDEQSKGANVVKNVQAQHVFFDLIDEFQYNLIGGNYTIGDLLNFALEGTGFTYVVEGLTEQKTIFNYGEKNVLKLVQEACEVWGAEWELDNYHITIKQQIGKITDNQFRYKTNLKTLKKNVDTNQLTTKIRGYGQGFFVDYTSPNADIYGIRHDEPIRNDEITDQDAMTELLKRTIKDEPSLLIQVELAQLDFDVNKGDQIILIYEPLKIQMVVRITEIEFYPEQPRTSKITISNDFETFTDFVSLLAKDVEKVEKNNEINRSEIRQSNSEIDLRVSSVETDVDGLDTRLTSAESSITLNSDNIELKVSETDYNGDTIVSKINLSSSTALIQAENIDLLGKVTFSDFDTTTQSKIDSKVDSSSLGSLAYDDLVEKAKLGTTVIEGGYIRADLLAADRIVAGSLDTNAEINVGTNATIGEKLYLGGTTSNREIRFTSGARITTPSTYSLSISASDTYIDDGNVYLRDVSVSGNLTVSGSGVSLSGHNHGNTYTKDLYGQNLAFWYNSTTGNLGVYVNGSLVKSI